MTLSPTPTINTCFYRQDLSPCLWNRWVTLFPAALGIKSIPSCVGSSPASDSMASMGPGTSSRVSRGSLAHRTLRYASRIPPFSWRNRPEGTCPSLHEFLIAEPLLSELSLRGTNEGLTLSVRLARPFWYSYPPWHLMHRALPDLT